MDSNPYIADHVTTFLWGEVRRQRQAIRDGLLAPSAPEPTLGTALDSINDAPSWDTVFNWFGIECEDDEDTEAYACLSGQYFNLAQLLAAHGPDARIMEDLFAV